MAVQIAIIGCGGMANGHLNTYLTIHQTAPGKVDFVAMCAESNACGQAGDYEAVAARDIEVYQKPSDERWGL